MLGDLELGARTYPRVQLPKVTNWIRALGVYALPLVEISTRKLHARAEAGELTETVLQRMDLWKRDAGIADPDELEYKYFLQAIDAINERSIEPDELSIPALGDMRLGELLDLGRRNAKMYYLSASGRKLKVALDNRRSDIYEATLFWMLLRTKSFDLLIQRVVSDPRSYQIALTESAVPSQDAVSRRMTVSWLQSLGIVHEQMLDARKLAAALLMAVIFELNECYVSEKSAAYYVDELSRRLSQKFSLSESIVSFRALLDLIVARAPSGCVLVYPSGRGHAGLPTEPLIQLLEFRKAIPPYLPQWQAGAELGSVIRHQGAQA